MKLNPLSLSLTVLCSIAATPALAEGGQRDNVINCDEARDTAEMNQCTYQAYLAADKILNMRYKTLMTQMNNDIAFQENENDDLALQAAKKNKDLLVKAQKAWLTFRDTHCDSEAWSLMQDGSGATAVLNSCLTKMTKARTQELSQY